MTKITLKGTAWKTNGELPAIGSTAADFTLTGGSLQAVGLADFAGKRKVISTVPSLDTGVCAASTRRFNEQASALEDTVVLIVSGDLPFAQNRFCEAEGLADVVPLSMIRSKNFARDYGVLIVDGPLEGLCARSVLVLDKDNTVMYTEWVEEIGEEPDYDKALQVLGG